MLRYYGTDKTAFECEDIVERHDKIYDKETRKFEVFDTLYQSLREGRHDVFEEMAAENNFMVTDIGIWMCELQLGNHDVNLIKYFLETAYKQSYRKNFLVGEAVVFYRNENHTQTKYKTVDNTRRFLFYLKAFIHRVCRWYPEQVNRLHLCGGIAPVHAVLQLPGYARAEVLEALLACNADINAQDRYGATVLHHAAWSGYRDDIEMLLERGADKTILDGQGRSPFDVALQQENFSMAELLKITGKEKIENTSERWGRYDDIRCLGGPLEFSDHVTYIPEEPDLQEFIQSLIISKHGSCNAILADDVLGNLKAEVDKLMNRISQLVEQEDPRFAFRPLLTGSVEQGGKVGPPDEFDFSCILIKFSSLCQEIVEPLHPGYCRLTSREKVPLEYAEFFDNEHLNFSKVNAKLFSMIEKSLAFIHLHGFDSELSTTLIINPPYRQVRLSTVAYKLYLRCNSPQLKNLKFKIDLAAVLSFKPFNLKVECFEGIEECLFVHIEDNNVAKVNCRISLTYQENAIFSICKKEKGNYIIKSYGLLKSLLSLLSSSWTLPESEFFAPNANTDGITKLGLDLIPTTYHIKQSLIKAILDYNYIPPPGYTGREIEFWAKTTVANLIESYKTRKMPTPWLAAHNVMEDHTKRRSANEPVPENGIDRCFEYLLAHANILRCILFQENVVQQDSSDSEDLEDRTELFTFSFI